MSLVLQHEVEAGPLNRVYVAEGATITIVGASKISLARPLRLPLPPAHDGDSAAVDVTHFLRNAASQSERPLVSLAVVGATGLKMPVEQAGRSLVSTTSVNREDSSSQERGARLKVKRVSAGALEVSSRHDTAREISSTINPRRMWPFSSLPASDDRVAAVEAAIRGVVGNGKTFDLLKVEASVSNMPLISRSAPIPSRCIISYGIADS